MAEPISVTMRRRDVAEAAAVGAVRRMASRAAGRANAHGARDEDGWRMDIEGACAEKAFSLATGVPWQRGVDTFKRTGDVGPYEVRHSVSHDHRLIIRAADPDDRAYILVTGTAPTMLVRGWITGAAAKAVEEWRRSPGGRPPAWFVPAEALHPIESLPDLDRWRGGEGSA